MRAQELYAIADRVRAPSYENVAQRLFDQLHAFHRDYQTYFHPDVAISFDPSLFTHTHPDLDIIYHKLYQASQEGKDTKYEMIADDFYNHPNIRFFSRQGEYVSVVMLESTGRNFSIQHNWSGPQERYEGTNDWSNIFLHRWHDSWANEYQIASEMIEAAKQNAMQILRCYCEDTGVSAPPQG